MIKNSVSEAARPASRRDDLDDLITDALLRSNRRSTPPHTVEQRRQYATLLQRAQTEVIQLPPSGLTDESSMVTTTHAPNALAYDQHAARASESGIPYNFSSQVSYYRSLVEMKMWCSVGILKLLGNSL